MYSLSTVIGTHLLHIATDSERVHKWLLDAFHLSEMWYPGDRVDLMIRIEEGYGEAFRDHYVRIRKDDQHICYERNDYMIAVNREFTQARIWIYDNFALKHALLNAYSGFITYHEWGIFLQSSCVVEREKAYIFAGASGSGKSTVAKVSEPRTILSDEATLLHISDGGEMWVYDSPFRSRLKSRNPLFRFRPAGIFLLYRSNEVKKRILQKADAMLHMMDHLFHWPYDEGEVQKALQLCKQVVDNVEVSQLFFQENDTFWRKMS